MKKVITRKLKKDRKKAKYNGNSSHVGRKAKRNKGQDMYEI